MSIITYSDFKAGQQIASLSNSGVRENLQEFIDEYEPKFLKSLLGLALYTEFIAAIADVNWDLIGLNTEPHVYTNADVDPVTGNISVFTAEIAPQRRLLSVYAASEQVVGVGYNISTGEVSGLGGYIGIPTAFTMTFVVPNSTQTGDVFQDPIASEIDPKWVALRTMAKPMIVCYVYYWYTRNEVTLTSGTGEVKPSNENSVPASSVNKQVVAWNKMVGLVREFNLDATVYPTWVNPCQQSYLFDYGLAYYNRGYCDSEICFPINSLNL